MIKTKTILTTMVLIESNNHEYLVQKRKSNDWPGINFPGGHVEDNELIIDCAKREIFEETGLSIFNLIPSGYFEWNMEDKHERHLAMLFKTRSYQGEIHSSMEGEIFWLKEEDFDKYPKSTDFLEVFNTILKNNPWID